jgi:membrane-associated phospholipid phosphatase
MKQYLPHTTAALASLFILLAIAVSTLFDGVVHIDSLTHSLVVPFQNTTGVAVFEVITFVGSTVGILVGLIAVGIFYRHRPDLIARMALAIVGSTISVESIKILLHRARPEMVLGLVKIHSYSFPSGHATASMVLYGFFALLLFVHARTPVRQFFALAVPALMIGLIGFSRIVLDYHYATDVMGGYLLGLFWITLALAIPMNWRLYHQDPDIHSEPIERPLL